MIKKELLNYQAMKKPIAHRGFHDKENPENSLGAFKKAISKKIPIELDVYLTIDNTLVVFHDLRTDRLTNQDYFTICLRKEMLPLCRLKNSIYVIPTLKEVLDLVIGQVPIIIDLKGNYKGKDLEKSVVEILKSYKGEVMISAFSNKRLKKIRKLNSDIPLIKNCYNYNLFKLFKKIFNYKNTFDILSLSIELVDVHKTAKIRKKYPLITWTVDTLKEIKLSKEYFDNYIFDSSKVGSNLLIL